MKGQSELFGDKMTIEEFAKKHTVSVDKAFKLFRKCFPSRKRKYGQTLEIDSDDEKAMMYVYGTESHKMKYTDPTMKSVKKKRLKSFMTTTGKVFYRNAWKMTTTTIFRKRMWKK